MLYGVAANYFGLETISNIQIKRLSRGWQQRVAISKLLIAPRKIWLLDEPFVNLDSDGKELLSTIIESRKQQKGLVILTGHSLPELTFDQTVDLEEYV